MDLILREHLIRSFKFDPIDSDLESVFQVQKDFSEWLRNLDPRIILRFRHTAQEAFWNSSTTELSLEIPLKPRLFGQHYDAKDLLDAVPSLPWLKPTQIDLSNYLEPDRKNWVAGSGFVDTGTEVVGVVRIIKPSEQALEHSELEETLKNLPRPFTLHTSIQRLSAAEGQIMLAKRLKQAESEKTRVGGLLVRATEDAIEETKLSGDALFRVEMVLEVPRMSTSLVKADLAQITAELSRLGTPYVETFGAMPSIFATFPGSWQHVPFFETGRNVPHYLPLLGHPAKSPSTESSLSAHRLSENKCEIELFSKSHLNANAVIVGASGRGKSALVGKLTQSLLQDPNVTIFKVDVGGSHSRECKFFGGVETSFSLTESSNSNPFAILNSSVDENSRSVLANFLAVLILEKDEYSLSKSMRSQIDECLQSYVGQDPKHPCLRDFYERCPFFPRRELLARWVGNGIYARAFDHAGVKTSLAAPRLRYFNFSSIFDAADPEFAQAGMAAVLADFNNEMRLRPERRLVLICDETPFFIKKCFEFFKFTAANGRKFGNSLIPVVQQSKHLIVEDDSSLIDNAHHKFLMSWDGDEGEFEERFQLSPEQMLNIETLRTVPGEYSEFFYKFGERGYPVRLRLTPEEYWRITTTKSEKDKIEALMKNVPGLHLQEALKVLAVRI